MGHRRSDSDRAEESGNLVGDEMADFFSILATDIGMNSGNRDQMPGRLEGCGKDQFRHEKAAPPGGSAAMP
jgi:hypothetical protein